jgi:peptidoglycan/xylan/chitin deacetylase (PgdA/CDA1 family)
MYHKVGDPQEPTGGRLVPALGTRLFEAQLRHFDRHYRLVLASELVEAACSRGRRSRVPLAITFDDDLRAHFEVAAPIMERLGVPATFFVGGASLEGPHPFWWQLLQRALDLGMSPHDELLGPARQREAPSPQMLPRELARGVRLLSPLERDELTAGLLERVGGESPEPGLQEPELARLSAAGFELGFHTLRHEHLSLLGERELVGALVDGRERIERIAGRRLATIAYPFGDVDERVARAAEAVGYRFGFTTVPARFEDGTHPLLIGRFQPSYRSAGHTAMELARALALPR